MIGSLTDSHRKESDKAIDMNRGENVGHMRKLHSRKEQVEQRKPVENPEKSLLLVLIPH